MHYYNILRIMYLCFFRVFIIMYLKNALLYIYYNIFMLFCVFIIMSMYLINAFARRAIVSFSVAYLLVSLLYINDCMKLLH